jgi:hypothetical protein
MCADLLTEVAKGRRRAGATMEGVAGIQRKTLLLTGITLASLLLVVSRFKPVYWHPMDKLDISFARPGV